MIGVGMATAIAVDATIVRLILVPATMALLGKANWYLPAWLDRVLPHVEPHGAGTGTAGTGAAPGSAGDDSGALISRRTDGPPD